MVPQGAIPKGPNGTAVVQGSCPFRTCHCSSVTTSSDSPLEYSTWIFAISPAGALPKWSASISTELSPMRSRPVRSRVTGFLKSSPCATFSPLMESVKASAAVITHVALAALEVKATVRLKERAPEGALTAGLPSGNQIHCDPSNPIVFSRSSWPIHLADHSFSPVLKMAGLLQPEGLPAASQT